MTYLKSLSRFLLFPFIYIMQLSLFWNIGIYFRKEYSHVALKRALFAGVLTLLIAPSLQAASHAHLKLIERFDKPDTRGAIWYDGTDQDCAGDGDYDADGDGFDSADYAGTDCDDADATVYPGATDPCGDGTDQDCDGSDACSVADLVAGDLVISEVMQNPSITSDPDGEWFEIYNAAGFDIDLDGLLVYEPSDPTGETFTVSGTLEIAAGGYLVFGYSDDPSVNGGAAVDYAYGSAITLGNSSDDLALASSAEVIDILAWDNGATFPDEAGRAMNLDPASLDATSNDDGSNWCSAMSIFGLGDQGTPGSENDSCSGTVTDADGDGYDAIAYGGTDCDDTDASIYPGAPVIYDDGIDQDCDGVDETSVSVDWCNLQYPATTSTDSGVATESIYGQVYSAGLTEDPSTQAAGISAQVGYGDLGTDPSSDGSWAWTDASYNASPAVPNNNDEYLATLTVTTAGSYAYAYRFSGDMGVSWMYCDTGGSSASDPYDVGAQGVLTVGTDADGDGYYDDANGGDDCDDTDATVNPGAAEVCGDTIDNDCNGYVDDGCSCSYGIDDLVFGDLVISEIMPNPNTVSDSDAEWFEVYNNTACEVDLDGMDVYDRDTSSPDTFTISGTLILPAGDYLVLGKSTDTSLNDNLPVDYAYGSDMNLANSSDEVVIGNSAGEIDGVDYSTSSGWSVGNGYSMVLDPAYLDATSNDDPTWWCLSSTAYGSYNYGTPAAENDLCYSPYDADADGYDDTASGGTDCDDTNPDIYPGAPVVWDDAVDDDCDGVLEVSVPIDWCNLQYPTTTSSSPGAASADIYGQIYSAGLTEDTSTQAAGISAQVGYGDLDTDPTSDTSWTWVDASYNASPAVPNNNDEYQGSITIDAAGYYAYAYRFSGDEGASWTTCDTGGSSATDPYDVSAQGVITVGTDADGDGYFDTADGGDDCDDGDAAVNPGATEDTTNGIDDDCDGDVDESPSACSYVVDDLTTGDLIINEVMQNPSAVGDDLGEWFEVYNASGCEVDLDGLILSDLTSSSENHTVSGSLIVAAEGYVVFGRETDTGSNGGAPVDYAYGSDVILGNSSDELGVGNSAGYFDTIYWDNGATFPDPTGMSMTLDADYLDATLNDDGANWCKATSSFGDGDLGTPGAVNDDCGF